LLLFSVGCYDQRKLDGRTRTPAFSAHTKQATQKT
jgi:hypothetical protein